MKFKELLPIGSVVWLKGANKGLMIFGIGQTDQTNQMDYDYIGVLYPEGNMGVDTQFLFNHKDIETVIFRGYEDVERDRFVEKIQRYYDEQSKE